MLHGTLRGISGCTPHNGRHSASAIIVKGTASEWTPLLSAQTPHLRLKLRYP